jgi:hypothetical protein
VEVPGSTGRQYSFFFNITPQQCINASQIHIVTFSQWIFSTVIEQYNNISPPQTMLSSVIRHRLYLSRRVGPASVVSATVRSQSTTTVDKGKAFADDGRHEVWRDGINDHDNAPK